MIKKKVLNISGKDYPVDFDAGYVYEYFLEATAELGLGEVDREGNNKGIDLISDGVMLADLKSVKLFKFLAAFLFAGHKCDCSMKDVECSLTVEEAKKATLKLSEKQAANLYLEFTALMAGVPVDKIKNAMTQAAKKAGSKRRTTG